MGETEARPMMERNHERAQEYAGLLRHTAESMLELAEQLGEGGRELTSEERELLRFATVPMLRTSFKEMLVMFVAGENALNGPAFEDVARAFDELTKK